MKIVDLGYINYLECLDILEDLINKKDNYLIFATHNPVYTIGTDENDFKVEAIKVDRGGSITYFDEGTLMVYFAFNVKSPPIFFKNVIKAIDNFFKSLDKRIYYDKSKPGFYIENKKIASLGFRYKDGRSKHGVSIHLNPNLKNFNKIKPCNLDVVATSLYNERIYISPEEVKEKIIKEVKNVFKA